MPGKYTYSCCCCPSLKIPVPKFCYDIGQFFKKNIVKYSHVKGSIDLGFQVLNKEIENTINNNPNYKSLLDEEDKKIIKAYIAAKLMYISPDTIYSKVKPVIRSHIAIYYSKKLAYLESLNHDSIADDEHSISESLQLSDYVGQTNRASPTTQIMIDEGKDNGELVTVHTNIEVDTLGSVAAAIV